MRVEGLVEYLETQGHGTRGANLFVDFIPDDVKLATMLKSGLLPTNIDYTLPRYRGKERFQLIVRAADYPAGYARIADATERLTIAAPFLPSLPAGTVIGGLFFNFSRPRHEPLVYPLSVGNLIEFSVNFDCNYVIL